MDKTDATPIPPAPTGTPASGGSQSRLSSVLFWVLVAAVLFRVITAVTDKERKQAGEGLVRWQPHQDAAALAARSGKPILYDFTAAWCGPCRILDKEGWGDSSIAEMVNSSYVPARVVDRVSEDGRNSPEVAELHRRFGIQAFPTLIIADASGREIARTQGYGGRRALAAFLEANRSR